MSNVVSVTFARTIGFSRSLYTVAVALAGFLAASAAMFVYSLEAAEGSSASLASLWATSVSPFLPLLAALAGMEAWSGERSSGRIDTLLASPVRERDLVLGKFLGVWTVSVAAIVVSNISTTVAVSCFAPKTMSGQGMFSFLPAFAGLALQSALWTAAALAMSALTRSSALAAGLAISLTVAVPRGVWWALRRWSGAGASAFGEMPFDAHAYDFAAGLFSFSSVFFYSAGAYAFLFAATKTIETLRFAGKGYAARKFSGALSAFLCIVFAVCSYTLAKRLDFTVDVPFAERGGHVVGERTKRTLSEGRGGLEMTLFVSRKDPMFRPASHVLRSVAGAAGSAGGIRVSLRYVDPVWDFGPAQNLAKSGVEAPSIVFSRGPKSEIVPAGGSLDDRTIAAAIRKVALPAQRRTVLWTIGHGEASFESYGNSGMSDIARDLVREGYRNRNLELLKDAAIPDDTAFVFVAAPANDFARIETGRLDEYLRQGGRLMVMLDSVKPESLVSLLSTWGIKPVQAPLAGAKTLSGTDVLADTFADHPVARPLKNSHIVLEKPLSFQPAATVGQTSAGADRIEFSGLASVPSGAVAAISERGSGLGADIARAIRPTRIVAIGDSSFVANAQLSSRGGANRDFFLNCAAYLAGSQGMAGPGEGACVLSSGMDRTSRIRFALASAVAFPLLFCFAACFAVAARRRG